TALSYPAIRRHIGLNEDASQDERATNKEPVGADFFEGAVELFTWMFGSKLNGRAPVIEDSREITDLAVACGNAKARATMNKGRQLKVAILETKKTADRLASAMLEAREQLDAVLALATSSFADLTLAERRALRRDFRGVFKVARAIRTITESAA